MSRGDITANMQAALEADTVLMVPLVFMDFDGDPTFVWGGLEELIWNAQTWQPVGNLGAISSVTEASDGAVQTISLTLMGLPGTALTHALDVNYLNRTAQLYIGTFDEDFQIIDDAALFFAGPMSAMVPSETLGQASITITVESRESALRVSPLRWRTITDHQREHPGDLFYNYVDDMANKTVYWGQKDPSPPLGGGGFGGGLGPGGRGGRGGRGLRDFL